MIVARTANVAAAKLCQAYTAQTFCPCRIARPLAVVQADFELPQNWRNANRIVAMRKAKAKAYCGFYAHLAWNRLTAVSEAMAAYYAVVAGMRKMSKEERGAVLGQRR